MEYIFETCNFYVRCIVDEDINQLSVLTLESPTVMRHVFDGVPFDRNHAHKFIIENFPKSDVGTGFWVIEKKADRQVIGFCAAIPFDYFKSNDCEIGIVLGENYSNKGFGSEIVNGLLEFCTKNLQLIHVYATASPNNEFSIKLITKMGLHPIKDTTGNILIYKIPHRGDRVVFKQFLTNRCT